MSDAVDRAVEHIHAGQPATDGAGVRMTRVIATAELDHLTMSCFSIRTLK